MTSDQPVGSSISSCNSLNRSIEVSVICEMAPRSMRRWPSTREATRVSLTKRTQLVFVRSRPGRYTAAAPCASSNCICASGLPASACDIAELNASRCEVSPARRRSGSASGGARRMRSMAASAMSGSVSHVGQLISHSLGPREPNSYRNCSKASLNAAASLPDASAAAPNRADRPTGPSSNSAVNSLDAATWRPSRHIASDGAADATSP